MNLTHTSFYCYLFIKNTTLPNQQETETSWQKDEIPLHTVFTLRTQAIKRMSTAAAPTLFVTRLTREPARTMTQPFTPIRLPVKGSIHSPAGMVERYLKM